MKWFPKLEWYPYVSLFPDLLCYRLECHQFTQNTFQQLCTLSNFHKKKPVPKETRIPVVCVDNFRLVSLFLCSLIYCVIGLSVTGLRKIRFKGYTLR